MFGKFHARAGFMVLCLLGWPALASSASPPLTGNWARDDGGTRIHIAPCGDDLCAINTWVKNPKGKEHVGDELILTLRPVTDSRFKGKAYDVRRKMHFTMSITLQGTTMHTSGCVLLGIICKSASWKRID